MKSAITVSGILFFSAMLLVGCGLEGQETQANHSVVTTKHKVTAEQQAECAYVCGLAGKDPNPVQSGGCTCHDRYNEYPGTKAALATQRAECGYVCALNGKTSYNILPGGCACSDAPYVGK